jgi:hypothetical protein
MGKKKHKAINACNPRAWVGLRMLISMVAMKTFLPHSQSNHIPNDARLCTLQPRSSPRAGTVASSSKLKNELSFNFRAAYYILHTLGIELQTHLILY